MIDPTLKGFGPALNPGLKGPTVDKLKSDPKTEKGAAKPVQGIDAAFEGMLNDKLGVKPEISPAELKFSNHAKSRIASRGIELTAEDIVKMQEAVSKAGLKGSKESLILTDKAAFVVSIKNNTVITAVDKDSLKENVFTNIDSTIMI